MTEFRGREAVLPDRRLRVHPKIELTDRQKIAAARTIFSPGAYDIHTHLTFIPRLPHKMRALQVTEADLFEEAFAPKEYRSPATQEIKKRHSPLQNYHGRYYFDLGYDTSPTPMASTIGSIRKRTEKRHESPHYVVVSAATDERTLEAAVEATNGDENIVIVASSVSSTRSPESYRDEYRREPEEGVERHAQKVSNLGITALAAAAQYLHVVSPSLIRIGSGLREEGEYPGEHKVTSTFAEAAPHTDLFVYGSAVVAAQDQERTLRDRLDSLSAAIEVSQA